MTSVNFIVEWEEFAKSIKLLISVSGRVHTENMSSVNLFQRTGAPNENIVQNHINIALLNVL